jgi:hypothetical protein
MQHFLTNFHVPKEISLFLRLNYFFILQNLGYIIYTRILVNIPAVLCKFFLVGRYAVLLYRELKKYFAQSHAGFQDIFQVR